MEMSRIKPIQAKISPYTAVQGTTYEALECTIIPYPWPAAPGFKTSRVETVVMSDTGNDGGGPSSHSAGGAAATTGNDGEASIVSQSQDGDNGNESTVELLPNGGGDSEGDDPDQQTRTSSVKNNTLVEVSEAVDNTVDNVLVPAGFGKYRGTPGTSRKWPLEIPGYAQYSQVQVS